MTTATLKNTAVAMALGIAALALSAPASAEKLEQTYVKKNYRTITKSSTMIDEASGHEVGTEVTLSEITYSSSKFGRGQEIVYLNYDYVGGTGPHSGHYIDTYTDGSQCYGTFQGTQKLVAKSDGAWEATWDGTYAYVGGTGKCKGIKGSGTYKGSASASQPAVETGKEVVEY